MSLIATPKVILRSNRSLSSCSKGYLICPSSKHSIALHGDALVLFSVAVRALVSLSLSALMT